MRRILPIFILVVAACGTERQVGADDSITPPTVQTTTTSSVVTTTSIDLVSETTVMDETDLVASAIADLARRLEVPAEEVVVLSTEQVEWSDGSLGCPKEGVSYTQAIVEGARVLLDSNGRIYDYHLGADGQLVFCPSGEKDGGYEFVPPPGFND